MRKVPVRQRPLVAAAAVLLALLAVVAVGWSLIVTQDDAGPERPTAPGIIAGSSMITDATFRGRFLLVFFGFANCPDVCPLALDRFAQVLDLLGPEAARVQPLLVSVDPERDTPEVLRDYVTAVDPRILGLTGTPEQVKAVASAYKVYFAKAPPSEGSYSVDHSTYEYLMGPDGRNLYVLRSDAEPEKVADLIRGLIRQNASAMSLKVLQASFSWSTTG
jgi:protein SCO1